MVASLWHLVDQCDVVWCSVVWCEIVSWRILSYQYVAYEASVSVKFSALKSRFPYFRCARNGIQNTEIGLLVQNAPQKRLLRRFIYTLDKDDVFSPVMKS